MAEIAADYDMIFVFEMMSWMLKAGDDRMVVEVRTVTLEEMKNVDIRTVDPDTLVDVTQIHIDETLPKEERIKEFIRQVKNPYCFKMGDVIVKNVYSNDGVTLEERFKEYVRTLH